jgi:predicted nucleic acid-binding protein
MTALVDTSVLIDFLRGHSGAEEVLEREQAESQLHASEMTRLEVLAGMRPAEEVATRALLSTLIWHPVDADIAEGAGALGRTWLSSHRSIDGADLVIAATAIRVDGRLLTCNIKHFPMFADLRAPY